MCPARFHWLASYVSTAGAFRKFLIFRAYPQRPSRQYIYPTPPRASSTLLHIKTSAWNMLSDRADNACFFFSPSIIFYDSFLLFWSWDIEIMRGFLHARVLYWLIARLHNVQCIKLVQFNLHRHRPSFFLLWTKKEKKKKECIFQKPSNAGYNFGSKVIDRTTIMKHSVCTSNRLGSQRGLVLIRLSRLRWNRQTRAVDLW